MTTPTLGVNEHGTPVSIHTCTACGATFTVCPADQAGTFGEQCLDETCPSYDVTRDIDLFWEAMSDNGLVRRDR